METIGEQKLWSFGPDEEKSAATTTCTEVRKAPGHKVVSYIDLAKKVADLQFMNREHVLLFRGQKTDYKNRQGNTSVKPSLVGGSGEANASSSELIARFDKLGRAEFILESEYSRRKLLGVDRMKRQQILRWAILQHYEVCPTPLLDVTHSLRIAASFASDGADDEAFIFVLGAPNLSGAITASAEAGLQIVRLSGVCPPSAVRPHIQEGYLLGEYLEVAGLTGKGNYFHYEKEFCPPPFAEIFFQPAAQIHHLV